MATNSMYLQGYLDGLVEAGIITRTDTYRSLYHTKAGKRIEIISYAIRYWDENNILQKEIDLVDISKVRVVDGDIVVDYDVKHTESYK